MVVLSPSHSSSAVENAHARIRQPVHTSEHGACMIIVGALLRGFTNTQCICPFSVAYTLSRENMSVTLYTHFLYCLSRLISDIKRTNVFLAVFGERGREGLAKRGRRRRRPAGEFLFWGRRACRSRVNTFQRGMGVKRRSVLRVTRRP